jgi:hypothetical protein
MTAVHIGPPRNAAGGSNPVPFATVEHQLSMRNVPQTLESFITDLFNKGEWVQSRNEEHLALKHISNTRCHPLVEQKIGKGEAAIGQPRSADGLINVESVVAGIGTEHGNRRRIDIAQEGLNRRCTVAYGMTQRGRDDDPQGRVGTGWLRDRKGTPDARHAEMRVKREIAIELNKEMLADCVDTEDALAGTWAMSSKLSKEQVSNQLTFEYRRKTVGCSTQRVTLWHEGCVPLRWREQGWSERAPLVMPDKGIYQTPSFCLHV